MGFELTTLEEGDDYICGQHGGRFRILIFLAILDFVL